MARDNIVPGEPDRLVRRPRGVRPSRVRKRFASTTRLVGFTADDARHLTAGINVDEARQDAVRAAMGSILGDPVDEEESAHSERVPSGEWQVAGARALEASIRACFESAFDEEIIDKLAALGHDLVRPRSTGESPVKGHYIVTSIGRCFALCIEELAAEFDDPGEFALHIAAWIKRLTIEIDMLLAVYAAAARTPNWY